MLLGLEPPAFFTLLGTLLGLIGWLLVRIWNAYTARAAADVAAAKESASREVAVVRGDLNTLEGVVHQLNKDLPTVYTPLDRFEATRAELRTSVDTLTSKVDGIARDIHHKIDNSNNLAAARHTDLMNIILQRGAG
jgi:Flp pilus assembly protein CpaB